MAHRRGAIWTERMLLGLILMSLLGTLELIVAVHRRALVGTERVASVVALEPAAPAVVRAAPVAVVGDSAKKRAAVEKPASVAASPPEDPTKKIVASLAASAAAEIAAGVDADRRALVLEESIKSAVLDSRKWKRRDMLVRQQVEGLTKRADDLEAKVNALEAERDVLARERDATKAALSKAANRSGYAVLPYKGENGTWRRPIVVECVGGGVKIQPRGQSFTTMELSPFVHPRSSPFVRVIAAELLHIQGSETPDGAPAVPYLVFLVRPDGIRSYYEARTRLEPLGIAFGYELIDQDLVVDVPNFDNLATWDGSVPLEMPLETAPSSRTMLAMAAAKQDEEAGQGSANWPRASRSSGNGSGSSRPGGGASGMAGAAGEGASSPDDFVWPSRGATGGDNQKPVDGSGGKGGTADSTAAGMGGSGGGGLETNQPGGAGGSDLGGGGLGTGAGGQFTEPGGTGDSGGPVGIGAIAGGTGGGIAGSPPNSGNAGSPPNLGNAGLGQPGGSSGSRVRGSGGSGDADGGFGALASVRGKQSTPPGGDAADPALTPYDAGTADGKETGGTLTALPDFEPASDNAKRSGAGSLMGLAGGRTASSGSDSPASGPSTGARGGVGFDPPAASAAGGDSGPNGPAGGSPGSPGSPGSDSRSDFLKPPPGSASATATQANPDASPSLLSGYVASGAGDAAGSAAGGGTSSATASHNYGGPPPDSTASASSSAAGSAAALGSTSPSGSAAASANMSAGLSSSPASLPANLPANLPPNATPPSGSLPSGVSPTMASALANATSGLSLGSMAPPPSDSQSSGTPSMNVGPTFGSPSDSSKSNAPPPPPSRPALTMGSIEVPFEIVMVCRQGDLLIHPGGYRVTTRAMKDQGRGQDSLIARELRALVRQRAQVDPMIRPKPTIKFLVESGGSETFWTARRQLLFALPDWPMSLQVADAQTVRVFNKETW